MRHAHRPRSPSAHPPALTLAALLVLAGPASAQIPDEFTNLQVLPSGISRAEIVGTMRGFASSLGVRCNYCHAVSEQLNQPDDDFASDEKATKRKARLMIRMVESINEETLSVLPERSSPAIDVTCSTCHGGISRPVPVDLEIERAIDDTGIGAGLARYRELRDRHFGSRAYDFSFRPLNALAERLLAEERAGEAVRLLEINAEYNPTSLPTLLQLGQAHEHNGDTESALRVYRGILDLDSSLPFYDFYAGEARERIAAIGG